MHQTLCVVLCMHGHDETDFAMYVLTYVYEHVCQCHDMQQVFYFCPGSPQNAIEPMEGYCMLVANPIRPILIVTPLQKSFSARAVSRSHQRAEHILKNLQQEEEKRRLGREASIITAIPVAQEACYEPTCSPPSEQEEEGGACGGHTCKHCKIYALWVFFFPHSSPVLV